VEYFHDNHFTNLNLPRFEPAISRECAFPYKPSPAALLHVAASWGVAPSEVVMVGDSAKVRVPRLFWVASGL
jgi:phosphoglycolate phosphatase-like HAD superfamily hydrolase